MSNIAAAEWTYHRSPICHWTGFVNTSLLHSSRKCQFRIVSGKAFFRTLLGWPSESRLFWFGRCGAVVIVLRPLGCTFMSGRTASRVTWAVLYDRHARDSHGVHRVAETLLRETRRAARHRMRFRVAWHWLWKTNPMGYGAWCVVRIVEFISLMLRHQVPYKGRYLQTTVSPPTRRQLYCILICIT